MDEPFAGQCFGHTLEAPQYESRAEIARKLPSKFAASRDKDIGLGVVFFTYSVDILRLTPKQEVIFP
jgi:hypothetical protein